MAAKTKSEDRLVAVVADRLREQRSKRRMSLRAVAEHVGVHLSAVARWEKVEATAMPGGRELAALSDLFGVSADYLLGRQHGLEQTPGFPPESACVHLRVLEELENAATAGQFERAFKKCRGESWWWNMPAGAEVLPRREVIARYLAVARRWDAKNLMEDLLARAAATDGGAQSL